MFLLKEAKLRVSLGTVCLQPLVSAGELRPNPRQSLESFFSERT